MKESILDVLLYLFEHYFTNDTAPPMGDYPLGDKESLQASPLFSELTEAGFSAAEIRKAFDWLDALAEQRPDAATPRIGGPTRAFALDQDELDLDDLKWVVLMVLFNQPGSEAAYAWMETQMFLDEPEPVH